VDADRLFSAIDKCSVHIKVRQQEEQLIKQADELKRLNSELTTRYERTKNLSLHDHLTGMPNRRFMEMELGRVFTMAKRYGKPFSVIMLDIDHFKEYNDTYGHPAGDNLLMMAAATLTKEIRTIDFICRYGGEEFLIILPEIELLGAYEAAERIRKAVEVNMPVTISCGVSSFNSSISKKAELIQRADKALYQAKNMGRNRVEIEV
jgi:diguanylate cyclase (GGDEF)-like protein